MRLADWSMVGMVYGPIYPTRKARDETQGQRILKLLAEEQQKQKDAGDKIEE